MKEDERLISFADGRFKKLLHFFMFLKIVYSVACVGYEN